MKKLIVYVMSFFLTLPTILLPLSAAAAPEPVKLPIIMYHQICPDSKCCGEFTISPKTLEGDLAYLRDHGYTTISVEQLIAYSKGECNLPEKPIMITFDDGQESFLTYGLPLFEKYDMCAVLAIIGSVADSYTKTEDHHIRYSYFSWPALAELNASPNVELAVHSYDMHNLKKRKGCKINPGESTEEYMRRFNEDLAFIESRFRGYVGEVPRVFAYPFGYCCREAKEVLCARGYQVLFTCNSRVNHLYGDPKELLDLGRFNRANGMNRVQFFKKLGI